MRVAIQAPIPLLEDYCVLTNYQVCIPSLILEDKTYRDFYIHRRHQGDYVVLDCSGSEPRESVFLPDLLEATKLLKPNLVVAPDYDVSVTKTLGLSVPFISNYVGISEEWE